MRRTRQPPLAYRRRPVLAARLAAPVPPGTLQGGAGWAFPDSNPGRLAAWVESVRAIEGVEAEPLLLMTLLSGVRLQVARDELVSVLEQLWSWLTSRPRNMPHPLADLVVEALSPELKRVIESRGWRFGTDGEPVRKRGRPLEARAAWTAALLVEGELRRTGKIAATTARELALALVAVLLGRRNVEPPELYRARKRMGNPEPSDLALAIRERYETWLEREGVQSRNPAPDRADAAAYAAWRRRYIALPQFVGLYGAPGFAQLVLQDIPPKVWALFLSVEAPRIPGEPATADGTTSARESMHLPASTGKVRGALSARRREPAQRHPLRRR